MTKFERQLEEFLQMFGSMEPDNFLENAVPDCQDAIAFLWEEFRKQKETVRIKVVVSGGAVQDVVFPSELNNVQLEIRDYDVTDLDGPYIKIDENEESYQEMIFEGKGESKNN